MTWKWESQRKQYGRALVELGKERSDIVVLDADLSSSTRTADFAAAFPERFFNCGIAEQNMIDTAAGLAASGKRRVLVLWGNDRAMKQTPDKSSTSG